MKKMSAFAALLLVVCGWLECQNIEGNHDGFFNSFTGGDKRPLAYGSFHFQQNEYELVLGIGDKEKKEIPDRWYTDSLDGFYTEKGTFAVKKEGVFDYLYLTSRTGYRYKSRLGMLFHPRRLFLYDGSDIFFASDEGPRWSGYNPGIADIRTSSFLTEGEVKYNAFNFTAPDTYYLRPWVEGAEGNGIGEWIELAVERHIEENAAWMSDWPLDFFVISNGYVSFEKPALYEWNNRVKKIRIICESEKIDFVAELKDTPQFQEIKLPKSVTAARSVFRFVIEDVYKGTRWDDTCLNLIIPLGNQP